MHKRNSILKSDYKENHPFIFKSVYGSKSEHENLSIMIIDDSKRDIDLFEELVTEESTLKFSLSKWTNSKEALLALNQKLITPDIIVLDLVMPGMNGAMILKHLKLSRKSENIPIIIHSSMSNYINIGKVAALDAHAFFPKPIDAEKFQQFLFERIS